MHSSCGESWWCPASPAQVCRGRLRLSVREDGGSRTPTPSDRWALAPLCAALLAAATCFLVGGGPSAEQIAADGNKILIAIARFESQQGRWPTSLSEVGLPQVGPGPSRWTYEIEEDGFALHHGTHRTKGLVIVSVGRGSSLS